MPPRYCKWIFVGSYSREDGESFSELLKPLEEICEKAGEGYAFTATIRFAGSPKRVIFNVAESVYGAGLQADKKFTRKYVVANRQGELSLMEHDIRLCSRTRSTTIINRDGYKHPELLLALHEFYSRDEGYRKRNPEIAQPFIMIG